MGQKADQALTDFCAQHTCAELEEIFNKVGIPNQRAYEPGDIEKDPQYAERENLVEWEDQIFGEMKGIGITNRFKNNPSRIVASAPCPHPSPARLGLLLGYRAPVRAYRHGVAAQGRVIPTYRMGRGSPGPSTAFYISKGETNG